MPPQKRRRVVLILAFAFALAIVMGPGPGVYLINPDADGTTVRLVFGMPIVYAWTAFWFSVQVIVVLLSYFLLWRNPRT